MLYAINMEEEHIAKNFRLDHHPESLAQTPALITLKDHKKNSELVIQVT